jgi:glutamate-1-semialdehyde 2,1-aminomutase
VPVSKGQPPSDAENVIVLPWNDLALVERTLAARSKEIAALITEPVMCNSGGILPKPGFLEGLRTLCSKYGVVLIFDEVITGFRLAPGGAQEHFGVTPDLATFAKAVAGGFLVSVLAALMDEIATLATVHAGTYNSNPPCMAACKAALEALTADRNAAFRRIQARGEALIKGIRELGSRSGKKVSVRGLPACVHVSFGEPEEVVDYRTYARRDAAAQDRFWEALQDGGVRIVPEGTWFVSAAHTEEDIARTLETVERALR